jgi:hypothetical protein
MDQVEIDRAILWYFGGQGLGRQPGDFVHRIIRAIAVADQMNRDKLAVVFPDRVAAYIEVAHTTDGLEAVRRRVIAAVVPA